MFAASPENGMVPRILIVGKAVEVGLGEGVEGLEGDGVGVLVGVAVGVLGVLQETTPTMSAIPRNRTRNRYIPLLNIFQFIPDLLFLSLVRIELKTGASPY